MCGGTTGVHPAAAVSAPRITVIQLQGYQDIALEFMRCGAAIGRMAYSQVPFKFTQSRRCICGRGYSGRGTGWSGCQGVERALPAGMVLFCETDQVFNADGLSAVADCGSVVQAEHLMHLAVDHQQFGCSSACRGKAVRVTSSLPSLSRKCHGCM